MSIERYLAEYRQLLRVDGSFTQTEPLFKAFEKSLEHHLRHPTNDTTRWLLEHLTSLEMDDEAKWFLLIVLRNARKLCDSLFEPIVHAAVYEISPSTNRSFVEPAVREFGFKRVAERILKYLEEGSNFEKAGAINAYYWARVAARNDIDTYGELRQRIRDKYLTEFIENDNLQVRRCIIPSLSTDSSDYSAEVGGLLATAIKIARQHPDDYIRHRIEVQLGNESLLRPLPDRGT